jgi:hypothetical protein
MNATTNIRRRMRQSILVLMMSILFVGTTSALAETDEPGPFERLFRAIRHASQEPRHKTATHRTVHKEQTVDTTTSSSQTSNAGTTSDAVSKPPSNRNTRGATRVTGKKEDGLAYGKPVPGKTGLVTSPYSPDSGYIDVRGFAPGTPVKDPYTGKIFLTP